MKRTRLLLIMMAGVGISCLGGTAISETLEAISPDGQLKIAIDLANQIAYSVVYKNNEVVHPSPIGMQLESQILGKEAKLIGSETRTVDETIQPVVKEKRAQIRDRFNELTLKFEGDYSLIVRAYDDGVAYRFATNKEGKIKVVAETAEFHFSPEDLVYYPITKSMHTSFESNYSYLPIGEISPDQLAFLPVLAVRKDGVKILITESDLLDYPGMFMVGAEGADPILRGQFAPFPLEETQERDRTLRVTKGADYIADTDGKREFPWRVIVPTDRDASLIENDIVYRLASPCRLDDTAWIKPGKVAWDWWNAVNLYGVNFKAGFNTDTYKYYVDFAAKYGLEYIILDEGWSDTQNLLKLDPALNLRELVEYAKSKNVGVILWCVFLTLDRQLDAALDQFQEMGIKGIKVDFMDRDDQKIVNYYERVAREAAKRKLLVDFHGAYKPTGLQRAYPNLITREGVKGLEYDKWSDHSGPDYTVQLPFIRMVAGPMDYTPGAVLNAAKDCFQPIFNCPMSLGTRAHQMALYVVFESPLQMLADSPSHYLREPEMMEFLSKVPSVWDETRVLDAKVSEYVLLARRLGEEWYIGAITNWTPRSLDLDYSFLGSGSYQAFIYQDGQNADRYGADYLKTIKIVRPDSKSTLDLKPGGGWAARLIPMK